MSTGAPSRRQPPKFPRPDPVQRALSPTVAALMADPTPRAVEAFWATSSFPLVEPAPAGSAPGTHLVTFCWQDTDAEQVLLFINRITDETRLEESLMARIPGTDVWHIGYVMEADWRASYAFLVQQPGQRPAWLGEGNQVAIRAALDRGQVDPRNPAACRNRTGVAQSVVALPEAPAQAWLEERPDVPKGSLVAETGPQGREVLHHASDGVSGAAPLLVVLDGEVWTSVQSLPTTIDNLVADGLIPPLRAVFLPSGGRDARWADLGAADGTDAAVGYLVDVLFPALGERGWLPPADRVAVIGQSLGGLSALRLALRHPEVCGIALSQSASLWLDELETELGALPERPAAPRIHLAHGRQEWVLAPPHRTLAARLADHGVPCTAVAYNGGHDYAWWRGAVADALVWAWS